VPSRQDKAAQQEEEVDTEIAAIDQEDGPFGKIGPGAEVEEDNPKREKAAQRGEGFDLTHYCPLLETHPAAPEACASRRW
jgi:hypothetical protein